MAYKFNPFTGKLDVVANTALEISITDTGEYYTGTDVETALQEIGTGAILDSRYINITGNTMTGDFHLDGDFTNYNSALPDMGLIQTSDKRGYGTDYITDKQLSNVLIGGNARTENGGIRIDVTQDPDTLEIYLRSAWQSIIYDLTTEYGDFRHTPLSEQIYVWRGDSVSVGLNGRSIIQEYGADMGAYPTPEKLYGGSF